MMMSELLARLKLNNTARAIIITLILFGFMPGAQAQSSDGTQESSWESQTRKALSRLFSQRSREVSIEESILDTIIWEKSPYIPQRGMINDYEVVYKRINGRHQQVMFKNNGSLSTIFWDSVSNTYYNRLNRINALRDSVEVFGWHPYWMKNEYPNYKLNLLSTISYFSYDINPENGSYNESEAIEDWKSTPLIDLAHAQGVKVLLTVTNYGAAENRQFLGDRLLWNPLIDSLKVLLTARKAQGIDIDFEDIPPTMKSQFTDFVKKVHDEIGRDSIITVQIKPYNNREAIDFAALEKYVDYFILQGFDYGLVGCNGTPGPVSPLLSINSDCACIVNSFDYCLRQGIPARKIILGLPAYGTSWNLTGRGNNVKPTFERYITYEDIMSEYDNKYEPYYDPVTGSTFFKIENDDKSTQLIWYESAQSLDRKFDWANDHDLKGVAIWALGYDGAQPGIWNAIAGNFGTPALQQIEPIGIENGQVYGLVSIVLKNRRAIGFSVLILTGFFLLGLFISLLDGRVREAFFGSFAYRAVYSGVLILLFSVGILLAFPSLTGKFLLFLGMVVGGLIVYLVTNRYLVFRDKLP